MKLINWLIKIIINLFVSLIKKNKDSLKFLLEKSLRKELINYYDNGYLLGYAHIEKTILAAMKYQNNKQIIVDVGGADGTTPKIFLKYFPQNLIYVFEPIKENIIELKTLQSKNNKIILIPKAAGNITGNSKINIAERITSSSIFNLNPDKNSEVFKDILTSNSTEDIEITKIDLELPEDADVLILKIDVQGFELEVLKGGISSLMRTIFIVLEMNNHDGYKGSPKYFELDEFLRKQNFILFDIFPSNKDNGILKEWDTIYFNSNYYK